VFVTAVACLVVLLGGTVGAETGDGNPSPTCTLDFDAVPGLHEVDSDRFRTVGSTQDEYPCDELKALSDAQDAKTKALIDELGALWTERNEYETRLKEECIGGGGPAIDCVLDAKAAADARYLPAINELNAKYDAEIGYWYDVVIPELAACNQARISGEPFETDLLPEHHVAGSVSYTDADGEADTTTDSAVTADPTVCAGMRGRVDRIDEKLTEIQTERDAIDERLEYLELAVCTYGHECSSGRFERVSSEVAGELGFELDSETGNHFDVFYDPDRNEYVLAMRGSVALETPEQETEAVVANTAAFARSEARDWIDDHVDARLEGPAAWFVEEAANSFLGPPGSYTADVRPNPGAAPSNPTSPPTRLERDEFREPAGTRTSADVYRESIRTTGRNLQQFRRDWGDANLGQGGVIETPFGPVGRESEQYTEAMERTLRLARWAEARGATLTTVGHSKSGGEASASAVAVSAILADPDADPTSNPIVKAYVYDPAGVQSLTTRRFVEERTGDRQAATLVTSSEFQRKAVLSLRSEADPLTAVQERGDLDVFGDRWWNPANYCFVGCERFQQELAAFAPDAIGTQENVPVVEGSTFHGHSLDIIRESLLQQREQGDRVAEALTDERARAVDELTAAGC
jgi:hypothetical protein